MRTIGIDGDAHAPHVFAKTWRNVMKFERRQLLRLAAGATLLPGLSLAAWAQTYPTRTITLVVPYPPGGGVDAMARIVADKLSAALQQVVVDNRGGGGGLIGTRRWSKAAPDGYTLLLGHTGTISINPSLYANAGYDPRKDFAPIGLIASMPVVLIAHPSFPAKTDRRRHCAREEGSRQAQHRHVGGRHRRLHVGGTVQVGRRHRRRDHSLQGHRAGDERSARRACAGRVRRDAAGARQHPGRQAARDRGRRGRSASASCPTCRPSPSPDCRASSRCCTTACSRRPARRRPIVDRLNRELRKLVDTDEVKKRIQQRGRRSADLDARRNTPADIDQEEANGAALIRKLNLKVE